MTAPSLHEIATGKVAKSHRTGQPVRRNSYRVGERENRHWSAFNKHERNARMRAAEQYDREGKQPGKRNGPLGHVALDVLRELMRIVDFKTGRLEPAIATLEQRLRRSRGAVVSALARLREHGFLGWIRRVEPIENPDPFGPQVKQATNAYWFALPKEAADLVRRLLGRGPPPGDEVWRRAEQERELAAMLAAMPAEELARFRAGDDGPLAKALASIGRSLDLQNASLLNSQNPALQG